MVSLKAPNHKLIEKGEDWVILCTSKPYNQNVWTSLYDEFVTCKKCLKKIEKREVEQ